MCRSIHAIAIVFAGLALVGCKRASDEVAKPSAHDAPDAARSAQVKQSGQTAVDQLTLSQAAAIEDPTNATMIAFAPDGKTWASAGFNVVTVMQGDRQVARYQQPDTFLDAGSMGFSPDGKTIRIGTLDVDVATGALGATPTSSNLATWVVSKGYSTPPAFRLTAARKSDDGSMLIVSATSVPRTGREAPPPRVTGNVEWLIALDGATLQPTEVLWNAPRSSTFDRIAISDRFVAASGLGGLKVFARDALDKPIDLGMVAARIAWSADGELFAACDGGGTLALWRTGSWGAPAGTWKVDSGIPLSLAFDPARPLLAVGGNDGHVRVYTVDDAALAAPKLLADQDVGGLVQAVAWSPDGESLLVASAMPQGKIIRFAVAVSP
jgi:WD40 repeat protein